MSGQEETLGAGSQTGSGVPARTVGNYTVAGVATRVKAGPPADTDWGASPPPNGTMVWEGDGIGYVRLGGTWRVFAVCS